MQSGHGSSWCAALASLALWSVPAQAQTTTRASVTSGGAQGAGASSFGGLSADGQLVALASDAALVAGDSNGLADLFERDLAGGATALVTVGLGGAPANGTSYQGTLSADGRYQVFYSDASNLVPGDVNGSTDVFVRDRDTGIIVRASVDSRGMAADGPSYVSAGLRAISADGRYVVFSSYATNFAAEDWNESSDVFVRDLLAGTTLLVSADAQGLPVGGSYGPSISADGRFVAFQSESSALVPGDTNGAGDVFVLDLAAGPLERVSVASDGAQASGFYPSISGDGRTVGFVSYASNLVPGDAGFLADIFVHDRDTGETSCVSVSSAGVLGDANSAFYQPALSHDGRFVAFGSAAANLVPGDTNGRLDLFVHDRLDGTTARASVGAAGGQSNGDSWYAGISDDGRFVAFQSLASNLVAGDTNGALDVFVRDRGPLGDFASFCAGDGSSGACPCGNAGATGRGCDNAQATGGVLLAASGDPSRADVVLHGAGFPPAGSPTVLVIRSPGAVSASAFGDGLLCLSTEGLVRFGATLASGGASAHPVAHGAGPGTFRYQLWYRNTPQAFCDPSAAFNTSNGLAIVWP